MTDTVDDDLLRRIKILSERLWEGRAKTPDVRAWLENFDGRHCGDADQERLLALHLLASVSYFGLRELRVLLRAMYRDLFRYRLIQEIRERLHHTTDADAVAVEFAAELRRTRFVGMGNPAESGTHLLYYFRQENRLPRNLFAHQHELLTSSVTDPKVDFAHPELRRVVFIDDLCGSGEQSLRYSNTLLRDLRHVATRRKRSVDFHYLVVFGLARGLERARLDSDFDLVDAVSEMDDTYATFGTTSRVFRKPPPGITMQDSEVMANGYGAELWPDWPLGFDNGQLLLAFHHNVPDNSLPILWYDEAGTNWTPAFPRFPKVG